ncbi:dTDP-4-dehydrorhamnose 3,5-epimerase [Evansella clarkii]|uniref:dTDP-4-dehydrorhamnose 3,5-epimerase n=1 Tax=Evansella clarkii TaxID=79879 RepID=UPI000B435CB6|nr:dTDP-4-dehydrorhamnose 3,5-epimerase [Evansella clarkii]
MNVINTIFEEVKVITPRVFEDERGFFMETYNYINLKSYGIENTFVQDNHSLSVEKGTIRGLHYQLHPMSQAKLVRVIRGAVFDVVVDIRRESPDFGKWFGIELDENNKKQLLVPKGFAHGFCTLEQNTEVVYKVDEYYSPEADRGIMWNDPEIGITWPTSDPVLSEKDKNHPALSSAEVFQV